jgi:hypothetical protein
MGDSPLSCRGQRSISMAMGTDPSLRLRVTIGGTSGHAQVDLSPDGRMFVKYVNQAGDFSDRAFTMPSLTLTGSAANS